MAKALVGAVGSVADYRLVAELRRLRARVRALELELAEARAAQLVDASVHPAELLTLTESEHEPAYT